MGVRVGFEVGANWWRAQACDASDTAEDGAVRFDAIGVGGEVDGWPVPTICSKGVGDKQ